MELFSNTDLFPPFELPHGPGYSAQWMEDWRGYQILVPNGELIYIEEFFDRKISDRAVEYFLENDRLDWQHNHWKELSAEELADIKFTNINWKQDHIKLYGKIIPLPRLTAWYGDRGKSYTYSGITSQPDPWNKGLLYMKQRIEECAGSEFNSVLLNWYRDGDDHLNWHADDEKELGVNPIIASVSFGETREFLVRRNDDISKRLVLPLKHGSLLLMKGELQHFWQHSIPKRKRVKGSRFNLTFRYIDFP